MPTNCTLFDENGYRRIDWIEKAFGECIHSPLEQASFWIGLSSIGFWLCAVSSRYLIYLQFCVRKKFLCEKSDFDENGLKSFLLLLSSLSCVEWTSNLCQLQEQ